MTDFLFLEETSDLLDEQKTENLYKHSDNKFYAQHNSNNSFKKLKDHRTQREKTSQ